tara:strand:- start:6455 stop:6634 length:180 start_codon:yes stop_codon:yes gene_type:complete
MDIKLYEVGKTKPLILPKRAIRGYYKDFLTGETKVQANGKEFIVRDSLSEIAYLMGANT